MLQLPNNIILITVWVFYNTQKDTTVELQTHEAGEAANEIAHFLALQFSFLQQIDSLAIGKILNDEVARTTLLERILLRNDAIIDLLVTDSYGNDIARTNRYRAVPQSELGNRSQSEEFQLTKKEGYYLSPLYLRRGLPFFILGEAVVNAQNNTVGIIIAEVDARVMQDVVRRTTIAQQGGRAFIVDNQGIVVAHPDISEILAQKDFSFLPIVTALKSNPNIPFSAAYKNDVGDSVLGGWSPITVVVDDPIDSPWYVVVEKDVSHALRRVNRIILLSLGSLFFVFTLAAVSAWFISRRIVSPIEKVRRAVAQFGKGNFSERVSINSRDEIKDLADGFNHMAEEIAHYTDTLKKERDQTSAIVASLGDGLILYSPENKVMFLNPRAQEILWVSPKNVFGKLLDNQSEFSASLLKNFYDISTFPLKSWETKEYTIKTPKKTILQITHVVLRGPKGKSLGSMRVLHDITEEKEVEAMKSEFVSLASHQLRTPLSGIKWSLNMLLAGEFGKLARGHGKIIKNTLQANERMVRIVNDLLDVARIEEGRFDYALSAQSFEKIVERIAKKFSRQIQEKKLRIVFAKPKTPLPMVHVDPEKIEMAVENLIDNAVKYTGDEGKINIYFKASATHLTAFIKDTGIGIPKSQQLRVFSKFFRASNAMRLQTAGSGLGLFISKSIVEAHRGKIGFESEENKGSTFHISLPIGSKLTPKEKKRKSA